MDGWRDGWVVVGSGGFSSLWSRATERHARAHAASMRGGAGGRGGLARRPTHFQGVRCTKATCPFEKSSTGSTCSLSLLSHTSTVRGSSAPGGGGGRTTPLGQRRLGSGDRTGPTDSTSFHPWAAYCRVAASLTHAHMATGAAGPRRSPGNPLPNQPRHREHTHQSTRPAAPRAHLR